MNGSLRSKLFVWLSAAIIVTSVAIAVLSFVVRARDASEVEDAQLRQVALAIASQQRLDAVAPPLPDDDEENAEAHLVVRVLSSGSVNPDPHEDVGLPSTLHPGLQTLQSHSVAWRVMVARNAGGQAFGVAQQLVERNEQAWKSAMASLAPMLVLVPLLLLIVNLLLRQGFAPLVALSRHVDKVDGSRLTELDPDGVPLEAVPLVHAFNRMLSRVGVVLGQQRRMVADAAHELRTPVAATRVQADNLGHADLPDEARVRLGALQRGLERISELIEQLLRLARVQGVAEIVDKPVPLDVAVRAAIEETLPLAETNGVDLGCVRLDAAVIRGDPASVYALVRNAIDNAVRYTRTGGSVDVSVLVEAGFAQLIIEDTGPGIDASYRERVFEPFFRILGTPHSGSGLGLAIVRSAAQTLGGHVHLGSRADGRVGLRFTYQQRVAAGAQA